MRMVRSNCGQQNWFAHFNHMTVNATKGWSLVEDWCIRLHPSHTSNIQILSLRRLSFPVFWNLLCITVLLDWYMKNICIKLRHAFKMFGCLSVYSTGTWNYHDLHLTWLYAVTTHYLPALAQPHSPATTTTSGELKKKRLKWSLVCLCPSVSTLPVRLNIWRKKGGENGLITAVTFHLQPRGLAVGLKDSPSLPPLLPSAMSHLRFTASALQLLQPTGHGAN